MKCLPCKQPFLIPKTSPAFCSCFFSPDSKEQPLLKSLSCVSLTTFHGLNAFASHTNTTSSPPPRAVRFRGWYFITPLRCFSYFSRPPRSPWLQSWVALLSEKATRKLSLGSHFPSNKFQWRHTNISPTHLKGPAPYRVAFHSQNASRKGFSSFCTTPQGGNSRGQWLRLEAVNAVKFPVHQGHLANPWSWASPGWRGLEGPSAAKGGWVLRGPEQLSQREGLGFAVFLISMIITSST